MDCKSGAATGVGAEEEAGREAGVAAVDKAEAGIAEEETLGEGTADAIFAVNGLSSSSSFALCRECSF